jgi:L-lactate dehydrogenase
MLRARPRDPRGMCLLGIESWHMKIGIIGMGWVGSSVAMSTLHSGIARELVLNDLRAELAEGEAMDLSHGAAFYPAVLVRTGAIEDMRDCDAVVIAAGRGGGPTESRLALLRDNAIIVRDLARRLSGLRGLLIVVTNPVDVLTQIALEASALPPSRVLGTGTMLDTARLRQALGRELGLDPRSVHAQVIGEHGDSEVALWHSAQIGGVPLRRYPGWTQNHELRIASEVRRAAYEIIRRKGATNHAIGLVTATLLRWVLRDERRVLTVSRVQFGAHGIEGVALSLPTIVGINGALEVLEPELDATESLALQESASKLRAARAALAPRGAKSSRPTDERLRSIDDRDTTAVVLPHDLSRSFSVPVARQVCGVVG